MGSIKSYHITIVSGHNSCALVLALLCSRTYVLALLTLIKGHVFVLASVLHIVAIVMVCCDCWVFLSSHDRCSVPLLPPIDETLAQKSVRLSEASKPPRFVLACEKQPEPDYYENCRQKAELYLMAEPNIYSQQLETKQNPRLR